MAPGRRRRWRWRVWLLTVSGLLLTLVVGFYWIALHLDEWVLERVRSRLAESLGADVLIGSLDFDPWRRSVDLREIALRIRSETSEPAIFRAAGARLRLSLRGGLWDWAVGRYRLAELTVDRPSLQLDAGFFEESAGRSPGRRSLHLKIDRLEVRAGSFRFADSEIPLDFRADDVVVAGDWRDEHGAFLGSIGCRGSLRRPPFDPDLPFHLQSDLRWRGTRLELVDARLGAQGLQLHGHAAVDFARGARVEAEALAQADLDLLDPLFEESFASVGGKARWEFELTAGGGEPLEMRGPAEGSNVRFNRFEARRVRSRVSYRAGRVSLSDLEADAYGGVIRGAVGIGTSEPNTFDTKLRGDELSLHSLLALVGVPLPFQGPTEARLDLAGEIGDRQTWRGEGQATIATGGETPAGLPVQGGLEFEIEDGSLRGWGAAIETQGARLDLSLDVAIVPGERAGSVEISGLTEDASATQQGTLRVLDAVGIVAPPLLAQPLRGGGRVATRFDLGEGGDYHVLLELGGGSWAQVVFDGARLDLSRSADRIVVRELALERGADSFRGALVWDLAEDRLLSLEALGGPLPLDPLLRLAGLDATELGGTIAGDLRVERERTGLHGAGELRAAGLRWGGESIDRLVSSLAIRSDVVTFTGIELGAPALDGHGAGRLDLRTGAVEVEIGDLTVDTSRLELLRAADLELEGSLNVSGRLSLRDGTPGGDLRFDAESLSLDGVSPGALRGRVGIDSDGLEVWIAGAEDEAWQLQGRVGLEPSLPARLRVSLQGLSLQLLEGEHGPARVVLTGEVDVSGPLRDPAALGARAEFSTAALIAGRRTLKASRPFAARLADGEVVIGPLVLAGRGRELELTLAYQAETGAVDGKARGAIDLGLLAAFAPAVRVSGTAEVSLGLGGTLERMTLDGAVRAQGGRLSLRDFPQTLEQVTLDLGFAGDRFELRSFSALFGGGAVEARGSGAHDNGVPRDYVFEVTGSEVRVAYPEGFRGVYDARLELRERPDGMLGVGGRVEMLRGIYDRDFALFRLFGNEVRTRDAAPERDLGRNVQLDVELSARDNVWIRNDTADLEAGFSVTVRGDLDRPEVIGRARVLEGGELRFQGVDYRITSGSLDFVDPQRINPYLELTAQTEVEVYEIRLRVEGTLDRLEYELSSSPSLAQQDIIALLTTGRTLQEVDSEQAKRSGLYTGDLATNYFAGALTDPFEQQIRNALGLERLRIDPLLVRGEADPTARVTLGKEVTDDVLLIASTDLDRAEDQLYRVEWKASRTFRVSAERSPSGAIGGDFTYTDRLGRGGGSAASAATDESEARDEGAPVVSEIVILGLPRAQRDELMERLPLREGDRSERSAVYEAAEAIRRYCVSLGHVRAEVTTNREPDGADPARERVIFLVKTGPLVRIELTGLDERERSQVQDELERFFATSILTESLVVEVAEVVRKFFRERGFYTVEVDVDRTREQDERTIVLKVDRGRQVRVESLEVEGGEGLPRSRVEEQVLTREAGPFGRRILIPSVLEDDVEALRFLYRSEGFLRATVASPRIRLSADGTRAVVLLRIEQGPRYRVGSVAVDGSLPLPKEDVVGWSGLRVGDLPAGCDPRGGECDPGRARRARIPGCPRTGQLRARRGHRGDPHRGRDGRSQTPGRHQHHGEHPNQDEDHSQRAGARRGAADFQRRDPSKPAQPLPPGCVP